jgi:sortase B
LQSALKKKVFFKLMMAVCIGIVIASAAYIAVYVFKYFAQKNISANVSSLYESVMDYDNTLGDVLYDIYGMPYNPLLGTFGAQNAELVFADTAEGEGENPVQAAGHTFSSRELLLLAEQQGRKRFSGLLEINADFVGMLLINGLGMELPFVQTTNNEKYLTTNFEGGSSSYGTVFLSCYNDRLLTDKNNVLFGHHMTNGEIFAPLLKYKDINTVAAAPVIEMDSLSGRSKWLVFAAYTCEPDYGYINTKLEGAQFSELLDEINSRSIFHTNVEVSEDDQILTLSTCTYDFHDARFAVHARRLRPGEVIGEVTAVKNPSPKAYNVPKQLNMADITANNMAVLRHPSMVKNYYYQITEQGIEWYTGNTWQVQGAYNCYAADLQPGPYLSAIYIPNSRRAVIAADRFNGKNGISLLSSSTASGVFSPVGQGPITPPGSDARYPLLALNEDTLWLLYSVSQDDAERIYRVPISAAGWFGEPEEILANPAGTTVMPAGMVWINSQPLFVWHDKTNSALYAKYLSNLDAQQTEPADAADAVNAEAKEVFLPYSADADKITVYGLTEENALRVMYERNGRLTHETFDISFIENPNGAAAEAPEFAPEGALDEQNSGEFSESGESGEGSEDGESNISEDASVENEADSGLDSLGGLTSELGNILGIENDISTTEEITADDSAETEMPTEEALPAEETEMHAEEALPAEETAPAEAEETALPKSEGETVENAGETVSPEAEAAALPEGEAAAENAESAALTESEPATDITDNAALPEGASLLQGETSGEETLGQYMERLRQDADAAAAQRAGVIDGLRNALNP